MVTNCRSCTLSLLAVLITLGSQIAPVFGQARDEAAEKLTIVHLHRQARKLAETVGDAFHDDKSLSIVADQEENVLILRGHQDTIDRVVKLLKVLDKPKKSVTITVSLSVAAVGEESGQQLGDEIQLTTLSDNIAKLQFGQQVSVPSGRTQQFGGRTVVRDMQSVETGTLIEATPRITEEGIAFELMVEKSWLEAVPAQDEGEQPIPAPPRILTTVLDTTLLINDGEKQTVRARVSGDEDHEREVLITVSATIGAKQVARSNARSSQSSGRSSGRSSVGRSGSTRPGTPSPARTVDSATLVTAASRMFERFDTSKDGNLDADEWENSQGFSRLMESRGFKFSAPMNKKSFLEQYQKFIEFNRSRNGSRGGTSRNRSSYNRGQGSGRQSQREAENKTDSAETEKPKSSETKPEKDESPANNDAATEQESPSKEENAESSSD